MCAIAGIINSLNCRDSTPDLQKMLVLMRHRGPDNTGVWTDKAGAHLGFNRLSIVDLSEKGNQPLLNEDSSLVLVANGEIYNYKELRQGLSGLGHVFRSMTDAETILHAYEEWGAGCLQKLRGMFAFAIWDTRKKELFLARDRIGIKPLYYLQSRGTIFFASELKAFIAAQGDGAWQLDLNEDILGLYFNFPFIKDNRNTLIKGIKKLEPAHFAVWKNGQFSTKRYWQLEKHNGKKLNFEEALEQTELKLKEAVNCHFTGDVPVALMLSGGLDSSLIGALALNCNKRIDMALTASYSDFALDERKYARLAADHLGLRLEELMVDPTEVADNFSEFIWYFDDLSNIEFFFHIYMSRKISQLGYKVILVGQGADEIFGGYHIFKLSMLPFSMLPSGIWNMCYYKLLTGKKFGPGYFKHTKLIKKNTLFSGKDLHNLCSDFELECQLPSYNLVSEDKGFMSHSVESRVPYLDHELVEFVYDLPQRYKLKGRFFSRKGEIAKYILRRIAAKYLPQAISQRRKQGVGLSLEVIAKDKDRVRGSLMAANSRVRKYFKEKELQAVFKDYHANMGFIFRLYVFETWTKMYLKTDGAG